MYDASGFLYSVPVYDMQHQFIGLVSSIVRGQCVRGGLAEHAVSVLDPKTRKKRPKPG
jgi:hypothetical protein